MQDIMEDDGSTRKRVHITLLDGTRWLGCEIFLPTGSRLSDVLNDERKFIPVVRYSGDVVVNKSEIKHIVEDTGEE
jgi:hypothetical protein